MVYFIEGMGSVKIFWFVIFLMELFLEASALLRLKDW